MTIQDLAPVEQPHEFTILAEQVPPDLLIRLRGELDFACADRLTAVDRSDLYAILRVDVDLSGLVFSDLAGLRALLEFRRRHLDAGRAVTLRGPRPAVRRVFELAGQAHVLAA